MADQRTKLWYLKNLGIFGRLRADEVRMIDEHSHMREVKKGEVLYLQGSSDKNFYILKSGVVKIAKLTPQGNEIILDIFSGGTVFGELAGAEPLERDESAIVLENALLCVMQRSDFDELIRTVPGLAVRVNKLIGLKRWKIENKLIDLLYRTVEQRLAKTLLNLIADFGEPRGSGYLLKIKLTHKDYADLIASTRETVTATLGRMKSEGLIDLEDKYVIVRSREKLAQMAA